MGFPRSPVEDVVWVDPYGRIVKRGKVRQAPWAGLSHAEARLVLTRSIGRAKQQGEDWVRFLLDTTGAWKGNWNASGPMRGTKFTKRVARVLADDFEQRAAFEAAYRLGGRVMAARWARQAFAPVPRPKKTREEALALARLARTRKAGQRQAHAEKQLEQAVGALARAEKRVAFWRAKVGVKPPPPTSKKPPKRARKRA